MGYYRGDYYRGDYYRGDFLGLGHLFHNVVKDVGGAVGGAIGGFLKGGPLGSILGGIRGLVAAGSHPSLPQPGGGAIAVPGGMSLQAISMAPPPLQTQVGLINSGGTSATQIGLINRTAALDTGGLPRQRGFHPNKETYETRGGGTSRWPTGLAVHPKGSVLVPNRRMNVGNARALKRALRRARGFERLARQVLSITHGHRVGTKFKKRGRKR